MKKAITTDEVPELKAQLNRVRQQCLAASRENDFRAVARLTTEAAQLNRAIHSHEEFAGCAAKSLALVDALLQFDDEGKFEFPPMATIPETESSAATPLAEAA